MIDVIKVFTNLDWYIGDNVKDSITLVSANNPGKDHSKESVIGAIPHELVHTIVYRLNPKAPLWVNEGLALYLSNGRPLESIKHMKLPSFEDIQTNNPISFANIGGYDLAHSYIEYLDKTYGFASVLDFVKGDLSYEKSFGHTEMEVYLGWMTYLNEIYGD